MAGLAFRLLSRLRSFAVDVDLTAGHETVALVGPSGAGKTTVLRCIAGLRRPDAGRVALGHDVWLDSGAGVDLPPERRSVGLVPQHHSLFPHMTVAANVAFGGRERAEEMLRRLGVEHLAGELPGRLSGGERQRVALARALAREPAVLLLDEPLAALDAQTRATVRAELQDLLAALSIPALLVTHDFRDAAALADRIAVMQDGLLHQVGTAAELLEHPADAFVAAFTGANLLPGTAAGHVVTLDSGVVVRTGEPASGRVGVVVQPWEVRVALEAPEDGNAVPGVVEAVTPAGGRARVRIAGLEAEASEPPPRGTRAWAVFDAASARVVALRPRG